MAATKTPARRTAETTAARKAAPKATPAKKAEPTEPTAEQLAAALTEEGSPEHGKLVAALTEPQYAFGVTKYAATKHYLQPSGNVAVTLCTGQPVKEVSRGADVQQRKLCAKCATAAETAAPVSEDKINWADPERRLVEAVPAAKPEVKATPAKAAAPKAEEPKVEEKPQATAEEPEPVVIVLPKGTTARMVREWVADAAQRGVFTGRENNRYRRALTRMGAVHSGNKDEAAPENLEYDITPLTDAATLDAHMAKFGKLYPDLDNSTLRGYVRNLGRVLAAYAEANEDLAAWRKAHPVQASK